MNEDARTRMPAVADTAPPHGEAGTGEGEGWQQGGTALVMVASVIAYGVMASGCAGV